MKSRLTALGRADHIASGLGEMLGDRSNAPEFDLEEDTVHRGIEPAAAATTSAAWPLRAT